MWIFTTNGFASVVANQREEGGFLVRFRSEIDGLNFIREAYANHARKPKLLTNTDSDYRWRVVVRPNILGNYLLDTLDKLTYPNFKSAVHECPDQENKGKAYMEVWSAMMGVQRMRNRPDELHRRKLARDYNALAGVELESPFDSLDEDELLEQRHPPRGQGFGGTLHVSTELPVWDDLDMVRSCPHCGKEREFQSKVWAARNYSARRSIEAARLVNRRWKCDGCNREIPFINWNMPLSRESQGFYVPSWEKEGNADV